MADPRLVIDNCEYSTEALAKAAWVSNGPEMYHWKCNDNLDTTAVVDAMGNKNGVSYRNTNLLSVTGKIDRALSFNGTSDYINLGTFTTHNTFFLSCWVVSKGTNKVWHMISKLTDKDAWSDFGICKDTKDSVQFSIGGEHKSFSTWSELTNGDHLMFVGVNKVLKVYKNNILIATLTYSKNFSESGTGSMAFGRAGGGSRYYFDGTLDDIRYGTFELTEADRDFIYNSGNGTESSIGPTQIDVTSEATIKQQGDYSLKLVMPETTALNKKVTRTFSTPVSLANLDALDFDIRSSRTGSNIKITFTNSNAATIEVTPDIVSTDTWQSSATDISGIGNDDKNEITKIEVECLNADTENIMYLDKIIADIVSSGGGGISRSRMMI